MTSSPRRRTIRGGLAGLFVLAALLAVPALAAAATITVNTTADNAPGPGQCQGVAGDCSLRQAIDVANGESGATKIMVPAGDYALTIEPAGGTPNDSGDLNVEGEVTIEGAGARKTIIDAGAIEDRVLEFLGGDLHLVGLQITDGHTTDNNGGAGILQEGGELTLEKVAVTDNVAAEGGNGGGIAQEDGDLTIISSTLSGNKNSGDGGAIAGYGEDLTIENSTIADNEVNTGLYPGNPGWGAYGGAIEASGNTMVIKSSTIAENRIVDSNGGEAGAGSALAANPNSTEIVNTIVADNTGEMVGEPGQCVYDAPYTSLGHNIETQEPAGEARCFEDPTDVIADPLLGPLADNGGETDTMALQVGSPAIDTADAALCPATDQRGVARPVGGGCDIGAFEYVPPTPAPPAAQKPTPTPPAGGYFGIKKIVHNTKSGTINLGVKFTGSGEVTVSGKGMKALTKKVSSGLVYLKLVPSGSVKTRLRQEGKAEATATVSFKTAGNVWTRHRSLAFKMK